MQGAVDGQASKQALCSGDFSLWEVKSFPFDVDDLRVSVSGIGRDLRVARCANLHLEAVSIGAIRWQHTISGGTWVMNMVVPATRSVVCKHSNVYALTQI